jgi:hypothetical protein
MGRPAAGGASAEFDSGTQQKPCAPQPAEQGLQGIDQAIIKDYLMTQYYGSAKL